MYGSVTAEHVPRNQHRPFIGATPTQVTEMIDRYEPPYSAISRRTTLIAAVFNMVTTFLDGTILSLPFAFMNTGLVFGCILTIFTAIMTSFSLHILTMLARKLQAASLTDLVDKLLGPFYRKTFSMTLFLLLFFTVVGFMVIMKQLSKQILDFFLPDNNYFTELALIACTLLAYPLMLVDSLHTIRYACYMSFVAVVILLVCIALRAQTLIATSSDLIYSIPLWPKSWFDIFHAIPIISLIYICQLNSLAIYSQLASPSPTRMNTVIHTSLAIITILFLSFGACGLVILHAQQEKADNILLVFPVEDRIMFFGRLAMLVTLICSLPILVVPTRHLIADLFVTIKTTISVPRSWAISSPSSRFLIRDEETKRGDPELQPLLHLRPLTIDAEPTEETTKILRRESGGQGDEVDLGIQGLEDTWRQYVAPTLITLEESPRGLPALAQYDRQQPPVVSPSTTNSPSSEVIDPSLNSQRASSTGALIVIALFTAIFVPNVQFVWALIGSSVTLIISYLVPALCYISLCTSSHFKTNGTLLACYAAVIVAIMLIVSCNIAYFSAIHAFIHTHAAVV